MIFFRHSMLFNNQTDRCLLALVEYPYRQSTGVQAEEPDKREIVNQRHQALSQTAPRQIRCRSGKGGTLQLFKREDGIIRPESERFRAHTEGQTVQAELPVSRVVLGPPLYLERLPVDGERLCQGLKKFFSAPASSGKELSIGYAFSWHALNEGTPRFPSDPCPRACTCSAAYIAPTIPVPLSWTVHC